MNIHDEPPVLSDKYNSNSNKQPKSQTREPGWGYGLGGTSQAAADVSCPSFESLSPPQPLTPYAGVTHGVTGTMCTGALLAIMLRDWEFLMNVFQSAQPEMRLGPCQVWSGGR